MPRGRKKVEKEVGPQSAMIRGGIYLTVEGYRRLIGVASKQIIFSALRSDRIVGAVQIGNTWIIPRDAIMLEPKNITHGGYRELRRIKEEYARKTQQILEEKEARAHNRKRDIV